MAVYECDANFELIPADSMTRTCEENNWTGEDPRCGMYYVFKCNDPLPIEDPEYCVFRCGDSLPIYGAYCIAPRLKFKIFDKTFF